MWVLGESWIVVRRTTRKGPSRILRSWDGLDDGNIEKKGTSILVRGIKNSEVRSASLFFVGRTEDMAVFTDSSGKGMISTDFKCASHGAVDVLTRTVFRTASEKMSTNGIDRGMASAGAVHTGWDQRLAQVEAVEDGCLEYCIGHGVVTNAGIEAAPDAGVITNGSIVMGKLCGVIELLQGVLEGS